MTSTRLIRGSSPKAMLAMTETVERINKLAEVADR